MTGCWGSEPTTYGLTEAQWEKLRADFTTPAAPPQCKLPREPNGISPARCDLMAELGAMLFFDPEMSGNGTTSCASCHDAGTALKQRWFIDTRPMNNVSQTAAATFTKRNAISVVDVSLKFELAKQSANKDVFGWIGGYKPDGDTAPRHFTTPGAVLELAIDKAMATTPTQWTDKIRQRYQLQYNAVFGPIVSPQQVIEDSKEAFDAYFWRLVSIESPFDKFIRGEASSMSESARRGFGVFAGVGMCIECHRGPLFTDFEFHVTGVNQTGPNVASIDAGRFEITGNEADRGAFFTASLRGIDKTGPYMHTGSLSSLADVIAFYRRGGDAGGYSGTKDPRMLPSEMTDEDARDLEAFLGTLTGPPLPKELLSASPPSGICTVNGNIGLVCDGVCADIANDPMHCGSCEDACMPGMVCMGTCVPNPCPGPSQPCGGMCFDLQSDPYHCGSCTKQCNANQYCAMGTCV